MVGWTLFMSRPVDRRHVRVTPQSVTTGPHSPNYLTAAVLDGQALSGLLPRGWSFANGVAYDVTTTVAVPPVS